MIQCARTVVEIPSAAGTRIAALSNAGPARPASSNCNGWQHMRSDCLGRVFSQEVFALALSRAIISPTVDTGLLFRSSYCVRPRHRQVGAAVMSCDTISNWESEGTIHLDEWQRGRLCRML